MSQLQEELRRPVGMMELGSHLAAKACCCDMMCAELGRITGPLTEQMVREALFWCQNRYPMLHARLKKTESGDYGWHTDKHFAENNDVNAVPLTWMLRTDDQQAYQQIDTELQQSFEEGGYLWRVTVLSDGNHHDIVITLDHAITDAISFVMLFDQFMENCQLLAENQADKIYRETGPFPETIEKLVPTAQDAQALGGAPAGDYQPWLWQDYAPITERKPGNLWFHLDETHSQQLIKRSKEQGVTVNSSLGAACLLAAVDTIYGDDQARTVPFSSASSLRNICQPPLDDEAFGFFISVLSTLEEVGAGRGFWDVARSIGDNLKQVSAEKNSSGFFPSEFDARALEEFLPGMIQMQDQAKMFPIGVGTSSIGIVDVKASYGPFTVDDICWTTRMTTASHLFWFYALTFNGKMSFCLGYTRPLLSDKAAQSIVDKICKTIENI